MTELKRPLFTHHPALRNRLPFVALADLPTPLVPAPALSAELGAGVWIKRDGLSHPVYGGNKIRKFEFVFGDVLRKKARVVLTGGGLGSHHTLALAVVAQQLGLQAVCSYYCQPVTDEVRHNLRQSIPLDIDAHFCGDYAGLGVSFLAQYLRWLLRSRRLPYFVYPGAPGVLGTIGYVNSALEIGENLRQMDVPDPDYVYVAVGSCGTFAGLILGTKLAGLDSRVVGVRVIEEDVANAPKIARIATKTARYLRRRDPSLPRIEISEKEVALRDGYLGPGYAHPTAEGQAAVELVARTEGLRLETTYTGKAMAALIDHARREPGKRFLFVDTYTEAEGLAEGDYRDLPERFWPVFDAEHEVGCWCLRAQRDPGFCWKKR